MVWALERICAKAVAGLALSRQLGMSRLYDTNEYAPFVKDAVVDDPELMKIFHAEDDIPIFAASVAALSGKSLPDVTVADDYRVFASIVEMKEFERLRATLRRLEAMFSELLKEGTDTVRKKLAVEIGRIQQEFNERILEAKGALGEQTKWFGIEMLAGQVAGFLSPCAERLKTASMHRKANALKSELMSREDLASDLFFLMDLWSRHQVLEDERYRRYLREIPATTIWGQDENALPWYERPAEPDPSEPAVM